VNEVRHATKYRDEEAAKEIRGKTYKDPIGNSPFVLQFEYEANNQRYWKYDHMVLQMEDCIDVVELSSETNSTCKLTVLHVEPHVISAPKRMRIIP
jgi:hypothetical protein